MSTIPRTRERTASPQELADDRRRYLEAKDATSPIGNPDLHEPAGRSYREEFTLLWMRTGESDEVLRIHDCAQEELKDLAVKLVEGGAARYATASKTTTEIVVEAVDDLTERTTSTVTCQMLDWYVGEVKEQPTQGERGPQS